MRKEEEEENIFFFLQHLQSFLRWLDGLLPSLRILVDLKEGVWLENSRLQFKEKLLK